MNMRDLMNLMEGDSSKRNHAAAISVQRILRSMSKHHGEATRIFSHADVVKLGLEQDFERAKRAGLIRFEAQPDWWEAV